MPKCKYCARPLKGFGIKCRACRRYVLRWPHLILLAVVVVAAVVAITDLLLSHL